PHPDSHRRMCRHDRNGSLDRRRGELFIARTVDVELRRRGAGEGEARAFGEIQEALFVVGRYAPTSRLGSKPAVHQAGVHVGQSQTDREGTGERRFAAPGRAIDRDQGGSRHDTGSTSAPIERSAPRNPGKLTSATSTPSTSQGASAPTPATANAIARRW